MSIDGLATRHDLRLRPDATRVLAQLFVPGHALADGDEERASTLVERIIKLDESEVTQNLREVSARFVGRHADLEATFRHHADRIRNRLPPTMRLPEDRWLLLGATFTQEVSVEAAALCNPSAIMLPDQLGVSEGEIRFALSVRQIGEGHRSSIGFRIGILDRDGHVTINPTGPHAAAASATEPAPLSASAIRASALARPRNREATRWVLDRLEQPHTPSQLDGVLADLGSQRDTRTNSGETVRVLRALAARCYTATFSSTSELSDNVLCPATAAEANGVEDARFVRFVDDDGTITYYATYTAYDGHAIAQQLLSTTDFVTFGVSPVLGRAAENKGLALFPRRVGGRYAALTRHDGASNGVAFSRDIDVWDDASPLAQPRTMRDIVQTGNCGSPIETDAGWLVLTHGVGPMRTYTIGALLLDRDDPTKVIGVLPEPLLSPLPSERDGYVPNVVYSCGALAHGDTLLLPYGIADASIGIATASITELLAAMHAT